MMGEVHNLAWFGPVQYSTSIISEGRGGRLPSWSGACIGCRSFVIGDGDMSCTCCFEGFSRGGVWQREIDSIDGYCLLFL